MRGSSDQRPHLTAFEYEPVESRILVSSSSYTTTKGSIHQQPPNPLSLMHPLSSSICHLTDAPRARAGMQFRVQNRKPEYCEVRVEHIIILPSQGFPVQTLGYTTDYAASTSHSQAPHHMVHRNLQLQDILPDCLTALNSQFLTHRILLNSEFLTHRIDNAEQKLQADAFI